MKQSTIISLIPVVFILTFPSFLPTCTTSFSSVQTISRNDQCYPRAFQLDRNQPNSIERYQKENPSRSKYPCEYSLIFGDRETLYVPDDFSTIQVAVEHALTGDTIIVRDGTYHENVIVNKSLIIESQFGYTNCYVKPLDENKPTFELVSNSVTIRGFTLPESGVSLFLNNVNSCWVSKCYFYTTTKCIKLVDANLNLISDNIFGYFWTWQLFGIWMLSSHQNIIVNNTVNYCGGAGWGIYVQCSNKNMFDHNTFFDNNYGIICEDSTNNSVSNNTFNENFNGGLVISGCSSTKILNNSIGNTTRYGLYFEYSNHTLLRRNRFYGDGMFLPESYNNTVQNNTVNEKPLIYLEGLSDYTLIEDAGQVILINCENITIQNQEISNLEIGIEAWKTKNSTFTRCLFNDTFYQSIWLIHSSYNFVTNNSAFHCGNGIELLDSNFNYISNNTFYHTYDQAVFLHYAYWNIIQNNIIYDTIGNSFEIEESSDNILRNNTFTSCGCYVIFVRAFSYRNQFYCNNISNSYTGFCVMTGASENQFFHNTLIENGDNAGSSPDNLWDDGYPSGGNYWDDYKGSDQYSGSNQDQLGSDCIGDSPYFLNKFNTTKDRYPLLAPYDMLNSCSNGPYFELVDLPIQFHASAIGGYPSYSFIWDLGDGTHSFSQDFNHTYQEAGNFTVNLTVTDSHNNTKQITTWARIKNYNFPPLKPQQPMGEAYGLSNVSRSFSSMTSDEDAGDWIYYMWDWGDGSFSPWLGPFRTGQTITTPHVWTKTGHYQIRLRAWDRYQNGMTEWSSPFDVYVSDISLKILNRFLFISGQIQNIGPYQIPEIDWTFMVYGYRVNSYPESNHDGTIKLLLPAHLKKIRLIAFGFGTISISISAGNQQKTIDGFLFGPFVLTPF